MPNNVFAPSGIPTPPGSPSPFSHGKFTSQPQPYFAQPPSPLATPNQSRQQQQLQQQQPYVPVAPEERIGFLLGNSLVLQSIIGTGAYGVVYEAIDTTTNTRYAVKALSKLNPDGTPLDPRQVEYQTREIQLHFTASAHPNVVKLLKIVDAYPDCLYVVLEYCPEGDLFYNITECGQFVGKDELARKVFLQILDAVQYLHQSGIYHRDLKPENILVTDNGETLKLADFGLATALDRSEDYGCGSTFYMSPECLGQTSKRPFYYCAPNDVWSLGVILVNLTCGRNPWKQASVEDSTYRAYTRHQGFLKTILPLSDELDDILARIFTPNPDQRITLAELRQRILDCPRFTQQPQQQQVQQQVQVQQVQESPVVVAAQQQQQQPVVVCSSPPVVSSSDCAVYDECEEDDECEEEEEELQEVVDVDEDEDEEEELFQREFFTPVSTLSFSGGAESDCETDSDMSSMVDDDDEEFLNSSNHNNHNNINSMPLTPPPPMMAAHPPPPNVVDMMYNYEHENASMMAMDIQQAPMPIPFHLPQQQQQPQHIMPQQQQQQFMFHAPPVYHQQMPDAYQHQHMLPSQMPMQQQKPLPAMGMPQQQQQATAPPNHHQQQQQPMGFKLWSLGEWCYSLQSHFQQQITHMHPFQNHQTFLTGF